jgi:hypothetical protein
MSASVNKEKAYVGALYGLIGDVADVVTGIHRSGILDAKTYVVGYRATECGGEVSCCYCKNERRLDVSYRTVTGQQFGYHYVDDAETGLTLRQQLSEAGYFALKMLQRGSK